MTTNINDLIKEEASVAKIIVTALKNECDSIIKGITELKNTAANVMLPRIDQAPQKAQKMPTSQDLPTQTIHTTPV